MSLHHPRTLCIINRIRIQTRILTSKLKFKYFPKSILDWLQIILINRLWVLGTFFISDLSDPTENFKEHGQIEPKVDYQSKIWHSYRLSLVTQVLTRFARAKVKEKNFKTLLLAYLTNA
jgi:hypothetical protein